MKRLLILLIIILMLVTGCWDKREINELGFVQGIGIDKTKNGMVNLTIQVVKPSVLAGAGGIGGGGGGAAGKPYEVYDSKGVDFANAYANFNTELSRKLFLQQNEIIFLSEKYAKSGIYGALDFITRNPELRRTSYLVVVSGGSLDDLMKISKGIERYPYKEVLGMIQNQINTSCTYVSDINDFIETLEAEKKQPMVCRLEIIKENGKPSRMRCVGAAVFKKDKMIGILNEDEIKGIMLVLNKIKRSTFVLDKGPEEEKTHISFLVTKTDAKITPIINGENVSFNVEIYVESNLEEQEVKYNLSDPKMILKLQKLQEEKLKEKVQRGLNTVQKKYKVDVVGFGDRIHKKDPADWEKLKDRWEDIYPEVKINISVKAKIKRVGLTSEPIKMK
ncbi:MAG: Ger(x)C family spore germination protein [Thermoanaerobacteraceae bacterium]|nr:Ger(x)C family spore germination protein [Thermoanaerobacteraceae bacterium]